MEEIAKIIKDISGGNIKPIYFLMGEEPYYIDKLTELNEYLISKGIILQILSYYDSYDSSLLNFPKNSFVKDTSLKTGITISVFLFKFLNYSLPLNFSFTEYVPVAVPLFTTVKIQLPVVDSLKCLAVPNLIVEEELEKLEQLMIVFPEDV
jgi:hypothetical protein